MSFTDINDFSISLSFSYWNITANNADTYVQYVDLLSAAAARLFTVWDRKSSFTAV